MSTLPDNHRPGETPRRPAGPERRRRVSPILLGLLAIGLFALLPVGRHLYRIGANVPGLGRSVTVRVVDEHGKPVEGATVRWSDKVLVGFHEEDGDHESTTEPRGECALRFVQGAYLRSVRKSGFYPPAREEENGSFDRTSSTLEVHRVTLYKEDPPALMAVTQIGHQWRGPEPLAIGLHLVDTGEIPEGYTDTSRHAPYIVRKCLTRSLEKADVWIQVTRLGAPYRGRTGLTQEWRLTFTGRNGWVLVLGSPPSDQPFPFSRPMWRPPDRGYAARWEFTGRTCPTGFYLRCQGGRKYGKMENLCFQDGSATDSAGKAFGTQSLTLNTLLSEQLAETDGKSLNPLRGEARKERKTGRQTTHEGEFPYVVMLGAAERGSLIGVQRGVESGLDVNGRNGRGLTALMCAAVGGNPEVVRYLLDHGADPALTYWSELDRTEGEGSALSLAAEHGHVEVVKILIERGAEVDQELFFGYTALMKAAEQGQPQTVKTLLDHGADVNHLADAEVSAFLCSAIGGNVEASSILLAHGAILNHISGSNSNALIWAAENRKLEMVKFLVQRGIDIYQVGSQGNALQIARNKQFWEIANYLEDVMARNPRK